MIAKAGGEERAEGLRAGLHRRVPDPGRRVVPAPARDRRVDLPDPAGHDDRARTSPPTRAIRASRWSRRRRAGWSEVPATAREHGSNLLTMATIAPRRPAWSLPAAVAGSARLLAPLAIGGLCCCRCCCARATSASASGSTRASRSGSPTARCRTSRPRCGSTARRRCTTRCCTSGWRSSARTEEATHALSLLFAVLAVPAAWWAARGLFGETAGLAAALLAATNPFLTHYAQETRMYALVALLGVLACGTFGRAYVLAGTDLALAARGPAALGGGVRGRAGGADVHAQLGAVLRRRLRADVARAAGRRARGGAPRAVPRRPDRLRRRAPAVRAVAADARLPGPAHGRAVVRLARARRPARGARAGCSARSPSSACCWRRAPARSRPARPRARAASPPRGRALLAMGGLFVATLLVAYAASQVAPAWAARYLAVALPPLLLRDRRRARARRPARAGRRAAWWR